MLQELPPMARIGYARVSTSDQDSTAQEERLKAAGCTIVRAEKASAKTREGRDELASILEFIRPGDELVVVKLDRLGRNTRDVLNLLHDLESKGAALTVLEPAFSTKDAAGALLATVLGMVAQMEYAFIKERQRVGIEAAKAKGTYRGRKPSIPREKVLAMHAKGMGPTAIAKALKITRMTVHRTIKAEAAK